MSDKPIKRSSGQPTKYKPEYCDDLIEHFKYGYSYDSFAAKVNVHIDTLYQWEKDNPSFSEAKRLGLPHSRLFWEKTGINGVHGRIPGFNATVWIFNMKNRFKWHDNVKIQTIADPRDRSKDDEISKLSSQLQQIKAMTTNDREPT